MRRWLPEGMRKAAARAAVLAALLLATRVAVAAPAAARIDMLAGEPPIRLLGPNAAVALVGGATSEVAWELAPGYARLPAATEWEVFLSLDGGATFPVRLTPHLDADVRRIAVRVPAVASTEARLLLRFGDERHETAVLLPQRFVIAPPAVTLPIVATSPQLAACSPRGREEPPGRAGERALPRGAGVVAWMEGTRRGGHLRQRVAGSGLALQPATVSPPPALALAALPPEPSPVAPAPLATSAAAHPPPPAEELARRPRPPRPGADLRLLTQRQNE